MKKIISLLLVLALCLSLCACSLANVSDILNPKIEGRGYDSPEEAFLAYTEALKTGDVSKILATFAIETYVENYDVEEFLDTYRSYTLGSSFLDGNTPYTKQLNLIARQDQISRQLQYLYAYISMGDEINRTIITLTGNPYDDAGEFMDKFVMDDWMEILAEMQVDDDFQYLDDFMDDKNLDRAEEQLEDQCNIYGCEEIVPLALEVELDGEEYLMTINVARYGDKWYNLTLYGTIASVVGASQFTAGLCSEY